MKEPKPLGLFIWKVVSYLQQDLAESVRGNTLYEHQAI